MAAAAREDSLASLEALSAHVNRGLGKVECDIELFDFDYSRSDAPAGKDSSTSCAAKTRNRPRPRHILSGLEIAAECGQDTWAQGTGRAEQDLELAKAEVARLESVLKADAQQRVAAASQALCQLKENGRVARIHCLAGLSKRQVIEVKHLARSPPDAVRRTLTSVWLLLSGDLFRGRGADRLDDVREWAQCRKNLLADDNFVARLMAFDYNSLDEVPMLALRLAARRLGLQMESPDGGNSAGELAATNPCAAFLESNPATGDHHPSSRPMTGPVLGGRTPAPASLLPRLSSHCSESKAASLPRDGRTTPPCRPRLGSSSSSPLLQRSSVMASHQVAPHSLDIAEVQWASEPCGALLRWMHALLQDSISRRRLRADMVTAEAALKDAEAELAVARDAAKRAEASLADARRLSSVAHSPLTSASTKRAVYCRPSQGISAMIFKEATMSLHKGVWRQQSHHRRRMAPGACTSSSDKAAELSGGSPRSPARVPAVRGAWPRSPAGFAEPPGWPWASAGATVAY